MKKIFWILIGGIVLVGGFYAFNTYIYNQKQAEPEPIYVKDFEGEADPSRMTLQMQPWTWISTSLSDGAKIVPQNIKAFSITFGTQGQFTATTDCNSVGGAYSVKGQALTFENIYSTKMYCEGSQENDFIKTLSLVEKYTFTSKGELIFNLTGGGTAVLR